MKDKQNFVVDYFRGSKYLGGGGGEGCKMRYFDPRVELGYLLVVSIKALQLFKKSLI